MTASQLNDHLASGATHVCSCWRLTRKDGFSLGFTDHDVPLKFENTEFSPHAGLSARAIAATTGLSINNTEAIGVLSDAAITEEDIAAGRYDGASVTIWWVNWDDPEARKIRFKGTLGEITRSAGGFQAELRGLTDALNQPQGRSYLKSCSAVLGDARCRFDVNVPSHSVELTIETANDGQRFEFAEIPTFSPFWFVGGQLQVLSGAAQGLGAMIKSDDLRASSRMITLWQTISLPVVPGDRVRLIVGCDRRAETCREKFSNLLNFQGFPDLPGNQWLTARPDESLAAGSLSRIRGV